MNTSCWHSQDTHELIYEVSYQNAYGDALDLKNVIFVVNIPLLRTFIFKTWDAT